MLCTPSSRASVRVNPLIAAFDVEYAANPAMPRIHDTEPRLMMDPPPARIMPGATACAAKKWCRKLTARLSSQYPCVTSANA